MTTPASRSTQGEQAEGRADDRTQRPPEHLLGAEPVDVGRQPGAQLAAAHRVGAAHDAFDDAAEVADDRGRHDPQGAAGGSAVVEQPRGSGRVAQVGQHPAGQTRAPVPGQAQPDQGQPQPEDEAEDRAAAREPAHRSTRSSSGSLPIRTIAQ